ncbi:MAG: class I SAM-dependent methyltransferase [Desulforegulaceae bacterium]|nr:class I SAM-dependent methyltransferase [Desulforegulaceae bacterium]
MADISKWNNISKSLLLPLYFRAVESQKKDAIFVDEKAAEIIKNIDYDFERMDGFNIIQTATIMRESSFDSLVKRFIENNPDSIVINIGAGLDTRFFRMDNEKIIWYELDLPEIIETRKEIFDETERYKFIDASAFDMKWPEKINNNENRPVLLIAEGFLFYFPKSAVIELVKKLKKSFSGANFFFDAVTPAQAYSSFFNPALSMMDVWFKWGMDNIEELNFWDRDIETKEIIYYFKPSFERLGWYGWYSMIPAIRFGFYIISCILGKEREED